ncbi:trigger factor [Candidatus Gracilibacteria bacterium]|nr:trigger factor [Candidatus Gracilibacteria bacterium]
MKIDVKKLPKSEVQLTVAVSEEEMAKYEEQATKRISEQVEVPGFRKGTAPKYLVLARVGKEMFEEEVVRLALPQTYAKAVVDNKIEAIGSPRVTVKKQTPLEYEAIIPTFPDITIKDLDKLVIPEEKLEVSEKEMNDVVDEMRRYHATYKDLDRAVVKGDRMEIDFQGYDEGGAALDKTNSKNHPLVLGEGSLIPGFEEHLMGMKVGEKKRFPITFPKDYHYEPFKSKKVEFEVKVVKAQEPQLPELSEEFIEKIVGSKKSVEEFKTLVKEDVTARKSQEVHTKRENKLFEELIERSTLEVPPSLIDEEIDVMMEELKQRVESSGGNFDGFVEEMKKQKKDPRKDYEQEAQKRVKIRLILNHLFKTLPIEVSDDDMKAAYEELTKTADGDRKKAIEQQFKEQRGIYARVKNNMMLDKLLKKYLG